VGGARGQLVTGAVQSGCTGPQNHQSDHEQMRDGTEEGRAKKRANRAPIMKVLMLAMGVPSEMYYVA
jgi:hypothetical protein